MKRYRSENLIAFADELFRSAGMATASAATVAELLVEADLMGHDTHGLALAPGYLEALDKGEMLAAGEPEILSEHKAAVVWHGHRLSGIWLTAQALDLASTRARDYGTATVVIRESHHIGCLAAYLPRATARGQIAIIACSDPAVATVAPYGGLDPVFSPDPFAAGIPTGGDPILIDMSASITTNGMAARLNQSGRRFAGAWAQSADGRATDDPAVLFADDKGTLLPTGGHDHGHKGYGLALIIESLSQGLSGYGRADKPDFWGASVFIQVFEPDAFSGSTSFNRITGALVEYCHAARPVPGADAVRLPGERALARKREALKQGVALYPGIIDLLVPWSERYGIAEPPPI